MHTWRRRNGPSTAGQDGQRQRNVKKGDEEKMVVVVVEERTERGERGRERER